MFTWITFCKNWLNHFLQKPVHVDKKIHLLMKVNNFRMNLLKTSKAAFSKTITKDLRRMSPFNLHFQYI